MLVPHWVTPAGSIGKLVEGTNVSLTVSALNATQYQVISGSLPPGLSLSQPGLISGFLTSTLQNASYQFVIRASNSAGLSDRTFSISVDMQDTIRWVTPSGFLPVGPDDKMYAVNRQYVDFQLSAIADTLPVGQRIRYFISDSSRELPPGLQLTEDGKISGIVTEDPTLVGKIDDNGNYIYVNKIYPFEITATDGYFSTKQSFQIQVEGYPFYFRESLNPMPVTWLSNSNLGNFRADNNYVIKLDIYDPYPELGNVVFDWDTPVLNADGSAISKPPQFSLDTQTGVLYAVIPYQSAYNISYKFTVRAIKTDAETGSTSYRDKMFTLSIQGSVNNNISFNTDSTLENIYVGQQSELLIEAVNTLVNVSVRFEIVDGALPEGMSLLVNGLITGVPKFPGEYSFVVKATDSSQSGAATRKFTLTVLGEPSPEYTKIYVSPFLDKSDREKLKELVTDLSIFDPKIVYRKNDPAFGVQKDIKLYLEYGIEKVYLNVFADELRKYFYRKSIYFGDVVSVKASNLSGKYTHDVICVEMVDPVSPNVSEPILTQNKTIYANSIANMRERLGSISVEGSLISINEHVIPSFMRSVQSDGYVYGFKPVIILGYVNPGHGNSIVRKINQKLIDFKSIHFEVDRLVVEDTLASSEPKYLFFPKSAADASNSLEHTSYIIDDGISEELYTEDNEILFAELSDVQDIAVDRGSYILLETGDFILTESDKRIRIDFGGTRVSDIGDFILQENGDLILTESLDNLTLEDGKTAHRYLLQENWDFIVTEDEFFVEIEIGPVYVTIGDVLLQENNDLILIEDGSTIAIEVNLGILLQETGENLLTEAGETILIS